MFSERGDLLGKVIDENKMITSPEYLVVDEEEGYLYIECGTPTEHSILNYRLVESEFPSPHDCNVTKLVVTASMAEI